MNSHFLAFVALAFLGLGATTATAQTVITSVPYTINVSGKYILGDNLTTATASQTAISISAPNVVLDLNGFFVSGPGGGPVLNARPVIQIGNVSNVTIRNGTVANNETGISIFPSAGNHLIEKINFTRCFFRGMDFNFSASPGTRVRNNTFSNIGGAAPGAVTGQFAGIFASGGVSIERNLISTVTSTNEFDSIGIRAEATDFVVGNKISGCDVGVQMATGGKFLRNLTSNCTTPFMGGTNATGNN